MSLASSTMPESISTSMSVWNNTLLISYCTSSRLMVYLNPLTEAFISMNHHWPWSSLKANPQKNPGPGALHSAPKKTSPFHSHETLQPFTSLKLPPLLSPILKACTTKARKDASESESPPQSTVSASWLALLLEPPLMSSDIEINPLSLFWSP